MLAAGPETVLAGVWARRPEAARALAEGHGARAVDSFEDLLAHCDAVAFAVPPDVQAALAERAARAGRHLMLDKPLALTLAQAESLVRAVEEAGVVTQLMLTHCFRASTAAFVAGARDFGAFGARLAFVTGGFVRGPYATPWRREHGALHDLGPHAFDLLDAILGPIECVSGHGDPRRWVALTCRHAGGAVSEVALSGITPVPETVFRIELFGGRGALEFDAAAAAQDEAWPAARRAFADAVRSGRAGAPDVHRGLMLQRLIDAALRVLG
jgi:predicted dehydrogenase